MGTEVEPLRRWGAWLGLVLLIGAAAGLFPSLPLDVELFNLIHILRIASIAAFGALLILGRWRVVSTILLQTLALLGIVSRNLNLIPYLLTEWDESRLRGLAIGSSLPSWALSSIAFAYLWGSSLSLLRHPESQRVQCSVRFWSITTGVGFVMDLPGLTYAGLDMLPRMGTLPVAHHVAQALWTLCRVCILAASVLGWRLRRQPEEHQTTPRRIHRLLLLSCAIALLESIFSEFAYPGATIAQHALNLAWEELLPVALGAALATVVAIARNNAAQPPPAVIASSP